ncbi:MAG: HAMP domain-containing protein [Bacteroidetes bacterium]|nr:MAG: HAMP domain-containing protein [Bacteroidota bacterium]
MISVGRDDLIRRDGVAITEYGNGLFQTIRQSFQVAGKQYLVVGSIPLQWQYFITNRYLSPSIAGLTKNAQGYQLLPLQNKKISGEYFPIYGTNGYPLLHLVYSAQTENATLNTAAIWCKVLAVLCVLLFLHLLLWSFAMKANQGMAIVLLTASLLLVRWLTYLFSSYFFLYNLPLFDPGIFAAGVINRSLGDLLVNLLLMVWVLLFIRKLPPLPWFMPLAKKWLPGALQMVVCALAYAVVVWQLVYIVRSLVTDSSISFDTLSFFSLNEYSMAAFCSIVLVGYIFYLLLLLLTQWMRALEANFLVTVIAILAAIGSSYYFYYTLIPITWFFTVFLLAAMAFVLHCFWRSYSQMYSKQIWHFTWLMLLAIALGTVVHLALLQKQVKQLTQYAEQVAERTDPLGEQLMNFAYLSLDNNFLASKAPSFLQETSNRQCKDSILKSGFGGYLTKYDTRLYTYDAVYQPLFNDDTTSYFYFQILLKTAAKSTLVPNLYYVEGKGDKFSYFFKKDIFAADGRFLGAFVSVSKWATFKVETPFPELLANDAQYSSPANASEYIIFKNGKVLQQEGDWFLPYTVAAAANNQVFTYNAQRFFVHKASASKWVVFKLGNSTWLALLSLMVFLSIGFLVMFFGFTLLQRVANVILTKRSLTQLVAFTIQQKIQYTVLALGAISFVGVAIFTVSFFVYRFQNDSDVRLQKALKIISSNVGTIVKQTSADGSSQAFWQQSAMAVQAQLTELSEVFSVDVTVYDASGKVRATTQPYIFSKQILNAYINPLAYTSIVKKLSNEWVYQEQIGSLAFKSYYHPLYAANGDLLAVIQIPYLNSESEFRNQLSGFLGNLINLFALVFVLAGMAAFFVTNRITQSLTFLAQRMKLLSIAKHNEPIDYDGADEIADLVVAYNRMLEQLEQSVQELAISQKQAAWQEMAKQVAHEIKNPLTPMKLNLQFLQKAAQANNKPITDLVTSTTETVIEQIERLSKIAGEFSQFANIGTQATAAVNLHQEIQLVTQLFTTTQNLQINLQLHSEPITVWADSTQLSRLFTNIFKNAAEASENKVQLQVSTQILSAEFCEIVIQDDAGGMPPHVFAKAFEPNFTTKTSGTGLGLAICKRIVENFGGTITCTTQLGSGTQFTIQLPLANN